MTAKEMSHEVSESVKARVPADEVTAGMRPWVKTVLSLWLAYHVGGIVLAPAALPVTIVPRTAEEPVEPSPLLFGIFEKAYADYLSTLSMAHAHRFFAPEPGPGRRLRYEIETETGVIAGELPDDAAWPRLRYHRQLMLAERSGGKQRQEDWYAAYARGLLWGHGGERITLWQVTHELPTPAAVRSGLGLDDPQFEQVTLIRRWTAEELELPR